MARALQPLTERDLEVLDNLAYHERSAKDWQAKGYSVSLWARPLDVGGSNGSHHSQTLAKLEKRGLAVSKQRSFLRGSRGSKHFQITDEGRAVLANHHEEEA